MSKYLANIKGVLKSTKIVQYIIVILFIFTLYIFFGLDMTINKEAKDDIIPQVFYNGQIMKEYVSGPVLVNDHVMVPIRNFTEMLGVKPVWDSDNWIMTVRMNNKDVLLRVFSKSAMVNGKEVILPNAVSLTYGYVYVPVELISNILEMDMKYDRKNYTVYLKSK